MKYNGDAKIIKVKKSAPEGESADLFTDEPVKTPWEKEADKEAKAQKDFEQEIDYEPAPETDMDFMTEEEEKTKKKNVTIGLIVGLLLAALLIGGFIYHNQAGKVRDAAVSTTSKTTQTPGSLESTVSTTRHYVTRQLTVHRDENGRWRSYAGLEKTVGYTGVVGNDTGWWYVENDFVNFNFNGIASNDFGSWLIENGKVNQKFSGEYIYNNLMYRIQDGKVIGTAPLTTTTTSRSISTVTAPIVIPATGSNGTNNVTNSNGGNSSNGTTASTTTAHEHKWVAIYDGDAIVEDLSRFCQCPECGLKFKDRELLESHAYSMNHTLSEDPGDDAFNTGSTKHEVITGYTNGAVKWVCTVCKKETTNANEVDIAV